MQGGWVEIEAINLHVFGAGEWCKMPVQEKSQQLATLLFINNQARVRY